MYIYRGRTRIWNMKWISVGNMKYSYEMNIYIVEEQGNEIWNELVWDNY